MIDFNSPLELSNCSHSTGKHNIIISLIQRKSIKDPIFKSSSYDKSLGLATALKTTSQEVLSTDNRLKKLTHPNQAPSNIDKTSLV